MQQCWGDFFCVCTGNRKGKCGFGIFITIKLQYSIRTLKITIINISCLSTSSSVKVVFCFIRKIKMKERAVSSNFDIECHTSQGRNHGEILVATSAMVGRICPTWWR